MDDYEERVIREDCLTTFVGKCLEKLSENKVEQRNFNKIAVIMYNLKRDIDIKFWNDKIKNRQRVD